MTQEDLYDWIKNIYEDKNLSYDLKIARFKEIETISSEDLNGNVESYFYYVLGVCYSVEEKLIDAIRSFDKSYFSYESKNDFVEDTSILLRLGMAYGRTANYTKSLECLNICYKESMKKGNKMMASNAVNNIGSIFYSISNFEKAISNYKKALKLKREIGDNENLSLIILNIAKCYLDLQNNKNAKDYAIVCLDQLYKYRNDGVLGETYVVLGSSYLNLSKYEEAEEYFRKALAIFKKLNKKEWLIICYENFAASHIKKGDARQGIEFLRLCEMLLDEHLQKFREQIYHTYADAYDALGEHKTAFEYYKKFHNLKFKHLNDDALQSINELEISYQVEHEKQKAEIEKLRNVELVKLNEEKNEFLGLVAHDLKNPLSGILLSITSLKKNIERFSKDDLIQRLEKTEVITKRMQEIIKHLLDVNAIERGDYNLNSHDVNIVNVIKEAADEMTEQILSKKIKFMFEPSHDKIILKCDEIAFREVISNLISNAVKYSHAGRTVKVKTYFKSGHIFVDVIDNGMGIRKDELHKVFKKFAKTSNKPTAGESSTGLGLSIVKKLTELMKGEISVVSEEGKGSTFTLKF